MKVQELAGKRTRKEGIQEPFPTNGWQDYLTADQITHHLSIRLSVWSSIQDYPSVL